MENHLEFTKIQKILYNISRKAIFLSKIGLFMAKDTKTWPELAIGLYEKLTEQNAEITYEFQKMNIHVPSGANESSSHAHWIIDGTLKIRTENKK